MQKKRSIPQVVLLVILLSAILSSACNLSYALTREPTPNPPTEADSSTPQSSATAALPFPAPKLLLRTPSAGEPQELDAPLELIFDQPMDRESVERALRLAPTVVGDFVWQDDRTLSFVPDAPLARGAQYRVTLEETARNREGEALVEPLTFTFQTVGYLTISEVQPAPESEGVAPDTVVTVVFNRPIVPLTAIAQQEELPDPLTFSPAVKGSGEWLNTSIYRFHPAEGFLPATTYTAQIAAGLEDTLGSVLEEAYSWQFDTLRPAVTAWSPGTNAEHIGPSAVISMTFNQPMDHAAVERAFSLKISARNVAGSFTWQGGETRDAPETVRFTPRDPLPREVTCVATLLRNTPAQASDVGTVATHRWSFQTVRNPGLISTSPQDGETDVEPYGRVYFDFAGPMQREGFLDHLRITPTITQVYTYFRESDTEVSLSFKREPDTAYTLLLDAETLDKYGAPLGESVRVSFTTGDLAPYVSLNTQGGIGSFNAYEETQVYVTHRNVSQLDVRLYRLSPETFMELHAYGDYDYRQAFQPSRSALLRAWSVTPATPRNESGRTRLDMTGAGGDPLPPGLYYLELTAPEIHDADPDLRPERYTFIRSRYNLTLKHTRSESLAWLTDLRSGAPVANRSLRFYDEENGRHGAGSTAANGLYLVTDLPASSLWTPYFAFAGEPGDADFAVAYSDWDNGIRPWSFNVNGNYDAREYVGYLYTDRPIYRPGQTVYFKGIVRTDDDADYTLPTAFDTLRISVSDPEGNQIYSDTLTLNDMGTLFDELTLDTEAPLGGYYIQMSHSDPNFSASANFRVAEYRKPEFQMAVETDHDAYLNGGAIDVSAQASYYFGGAVADADVTWNVLSADYYFEYDCLTGERCPRYSWWDYTWEDRLEGDWYGGYGRLIAQGDATTDSAGRVTFTVPADISEERNSRRFTLEVNVTDVNNQVVSERTTAIVHQGAYYIGLAPEGRIAEAGEEQRVQILTADWDSAPVAEVPLELVLLRREWFNVRRQAEDEQFYWTWELEETPVTTTTVTTGADGKAVADFIPPEAGSYKIRASGYDEHENEIRSSAYFWAWGSSRVNWRRESTNRIDLIADQDEYTVGDTAEILIPSPYSGTVQALITIERGHLIETEVREFSSSTEVLRIPIAEEHVPNIFVSVVLVQGTADAPDGLATFKMGLVKLSVSTERQELNITLTPDRPMEDGEYYRPRETATYDIAVTDHTGAPVEAEISLRLADLAVLALADETGPTLLERFWSERGLGVRTALPLAVAMEAYNRDLEPGDKGGGGGGGGGAEAGFIRTNFADTAYWEAVVRTDARGRARVEVPLPDNLTTWRMQARGITAGTRVGRAEVDIRSTLDLLVRPVLPRFFVVGDQATIATLVHNNTEETLSTDVTLTVEGLDLAGERRQTVNIPAGEKAELLWPITVEPGDEVTVRMEARAGDYYDGREDSLPVYHFSTPEVVATAGRISEAGLRQELVQLPPEFDPTQGELTVQVDGSLTAATQDALTYLEHYPYECVEQTVSRFLPNVLTYQALQELGLKRPDLRRQLDEEVHVALQRLYNRQNYDGGWGWWLSDGSSPYLTAYVLQGMLEAQHAGFTVEEKGLAHAVVYLRAHLQSVPEMEQAWEANRLAYELYVLGEYLTHVAGAEEAGELGLAIRLYGRRELLDQYGQATLAVALSLLSPEETTRPASLLSNLLGEAIMSATGTHWEEARPDYWNMNTDMRSTAIVLWALARLEPESELLPNIVRWLMTMRKAGYWSNTQTTAWSLMALTEVMRASGELRGDYSFNVSLNGTVVLQGDVDAESIDESYRVELEIAQLLAEEANRLLITRDPPTDEQSGEGQLYYTAQLRYFLPVEQVEALDRGIIVARQYTPVADPETYVEGAEVGDVIRVKLTVIAPTDLHYVVVEDPLPAGCEAVDTTLNTTSVIGEQPSLHNLTAEETNYWYRWYGWGWWWFSHTEMRDEKVALFATYLPRGTYEYTYVMRASLPGTYHVIPATAYEMYFPEVFGRSAGTLFTVR